MIDVTAEQHEVLERLHRAGAEGVELGPDGCPLGMALLFGTHGLIEITNQRQPPQRAVVTQRGRGFMFRTAT